VAMPTVVTRAMRHPGMRAFLARALHPQQDLLWDSPDGGGLRHGAVNPSSPPGRSAAAVIDCSDQHGDGVSCTQTRDRNEQASSARVGMEYTLASPFSMTMDSRVGICAGHREHRRQRQSEGQGHDGDFQMLPEALSERSWVSLRIYSIIGISPECALGAARVSSETAQRGLRLAAGSLGRSNCRIFPSFMMIPGPQLEAS
jgi:hypothetical protein